MCVKQNGRCANFILMTIFFDDYIKYINFSVKYFFGLSCWNFFFFQTVHVLVYVFWYPMKKIMKVFIRAIIKIVSFGEISFCGMQSPIFHFNKIFLPLHSIFIICMQYSVSILSIYRQRIFSEDIVKLKWNRSATNAKKRKRTTF